MRYDDALAYIDEHANYEKTGRLTAPSTANIERLLAAMGDPHTTYPVIHITGTNGKGSTAQIITRLLMAYGLTVGTYVSPHLERINERMTRNAEPIDDVTFGEMVGAIADLEVIAGVRPTFFEIVTAAAFRWFADIAVDVAVVEVGMLGRWDATNVVDAQVAVVTNVGFDHMEFAGPTLADIAREKAGIVKANSTLVMGETDPAIVEIFRAEQPAAVVERGAHFECVENTLALGGRSLTLRTPTTVYRDVFLALNGRHQGDNAAVAVAAVEAFFEAPTPGDLVAEALAEVAVPGRFEVVGHQPLVILDGAHNPHGADRCAEVFFDDFDPAGRRILLVGCLSGREPDALLSALRADEFDLVICTTAPSPRGVPAADVAAAARSIGCDHVETIPSLEQACRAALGAAQPDDAVLVAGSLYVVGDARPILRRLGS
jgi:dihydrofolate synthase / folylpolyglutamate synthase